MECHGRTFPKTDLFPVVGQERPVQPGRISSSGCLAMRQPLLIFGSSANPGYAAGAMSVSRYAQSVGIRR